MAWQEIGPKRYARPLDTIESLWRMVSLSGRPYQKKPFLVSTAVRLKQAPSATDLQQAWKALHYKHPQLTAVADESELRLIYTILSPEDLEALVHKTLIVYPESDYRSAEDLDVTLEPDDAVALHYLPSAKELLFRTPHWRIDAIGLIYLQIDLFNFLTEGLSEKEFILDGSELSRFPPPLDIASPMKREISPEMSQAGDAELAIMAAGSTPAGLNETLPNTLPGDPRRIGTHIPQNQSQQIIAACKSRGFTVTGAVHAAIACVVKEHCTPKDGRLLCFPPYNLRDYLSTPWNGPAGATGVYHTGRALSVEFGEYKNFTEIAKFITAHYKRDMQPVFDCMVDYVPKVGAAMTAPLEMILQAPGAAHPELSSIGDIDNLLPLRFEGAAGIVEIDHWWVGVQMIGRMLQCYLWTRDGCLNLACHYNDAFYAHSFVQQFLDEWKATLIKELIG